MVVESFDCSKTDARLRRLRRFHDEQNSLRFRAIIIDFSGARTSQSPTVLRKNSTVVVGFSESLRATRKAAVLCSENAGRKSPDGNRFSIAIPKHRADTFIGAFFGESICWRKFKVSQRFFPTMRVLGSGKTARRRNDPDVSDRPEDSSRTTSLDAASTANPVNTNLVIAEENK